MTIANRIGGKRAKSNGEHFESLIEAACLFYKVSGQAFIEKTPEPMRPIRGANRQGQFVACYTKQAQPDYKGTLKGGRAVVFEAKHTANGRIERNRVTDEQATALDVHNELGAVCFVLVSFRFQNFYRVPWRIWRNMSEYYGKVSVNEQDLKPYQVDIMQFLNGLGA